jgi:hypothetical protein
VVVVVRSAEGSPANEDPGAALFPTFLPNCLCAHVNYYIILSTSSLVVQVGRAAPEASPLVSHKRAAIDSELIPELSFVAPRPFGGNRVAIPEQSERYIVLVYLLARYRAWERGASPRSHELPRDNREYRARGESSRENRSRSSHEQLLRDMHLLQVEIGW